MDKKQRNLSRILYLSGVECCPRRITDPPLFRSWFSLLLEVPTGWTWIAPPLKLTGIVKARLISFLWTPRPIVADKTVSMFMIWSWQNPRLRKQASKGVIQAFPVNKGARNTCKRFFFFFAKNLFSLPFVTKWLEEFWITSLQQLPFVACRKIDPNPQNQTPVPQHLR